MSLSYILVNIYIGDKMKPDRIAHKTHDKVGKVSKQVGRGKRINIQESQIPRWWENVDYCT